MRRMYSQNQLLETVKENITADDIKADNAQTVQENLERIDERIDDIDIEDLFDVLAKSRELDTGEVNTVQIQYDSLSQKWKIVFTH